MGEFAPVTEMESVGVTNPDGAGPCVLVCEHASKIVPSQYGDLGLDGPALDSHIAYDIGAQAVARGMAALLDAPLVWSQVSRLIVDCNRDADAHDLIPLKGEDRPIPGNSDLTADERQQRLDRYYHPFHTTLDRVLTARADVGLDTALVTVHSFTPVFMGVRRHLDLGVLHDADTRLADALLAVATQADELVTQRNEPYAPKDGVTHTLLRHGLARGLPNVMLEIRNTLIDTPDGQAKMAARLGGYVRSALDLDAAGLDPHARKVG